MSKFRDSLNRVVKGMELQYAVFLIILAGVALYADATGSGLATIIALVLFYVYAQLLNRALRIKRGDYGRV